MRLRAEAQLADPANTKPAAAEKANPLNSDTATPSVSENATITLFLIPAPNSSINACQEADNYYIKQLVHTALITIYTIVEPTTAANIPTLTHTDPATVPTVTGWNGFYQVYREKLLKYYINGLSSFMQKRSNIYIYVQPSHYATYFSPTTMNHQLI
jgi:hypothetical protein